MKRPFLVLLLIVSMFTWLAPPRAEAIDPVTIAILAPIALKTAEAMRPYVMRGLVMGTQGLIETGKDTLGILYLPWGAVQSTLGAPFGGIGPGIGNMAKGAMAPFKVVWDVLLLPLKFAGVSGG